MFKIKNYFLKLGRLKLNFVRLRITMEKVGAKSLFWWRLCTEDGT